MRLSVDDQLIRAAQELGPVIREHADEAERERRPSRPVMNALVETGLQRMFTPRSLGGLEVDPVTYARVTEEVAGFDSVAGWALQVGNSAAFWCARLPKEGPEEIYARGPNAIISAAFHPPQRAVEVSGGYRVTGRGPLASNIHDADWLFLTALVMDGDQPRMTDDTPEAIGLILRAREAEVIDTWYTLGMRGTDSNDVAVNEVFVPTSRTFRLVPEFEPGPHYQSPLYRFPGIGEATVIVAPVMLAIARGAINELRDLALRKKPFGFVKTLRERTVAQATLAQGEGVLRSARLLFYDTISEAWERTQAGEPSTLEQKADLLLAGAHAVSSAAKVTDQMHSLAGTSAIYTRSRLERHFRDAQTLRHHGFVSANRYEAVGQVYLGIPPEFGLVGF